MIRKKIILFLKNEKKIFHMIKTDDEQCRPSGTLIENSHKKYSGCNDLFSKENNNNGY